MATVSMVGKALLRQAEAIKPPCRMGPQTIVTGKTVETVPSSIVGRFAQQLPNLKLHACAKARRRINDKIDDIARQVVFILVSKRHANVVVSDTCGNHFCSNLPISQPVGFRGPFEVGSTPFL